MALEFWLLADPYSSEPSQSRWSSPPVTCASAPGHRRNGSTRPDTVIISGSPSDDFVWTWNNDLLLSERVQRVFVQNRVSGFEAAPVAVVFSKPTIQRPPKLFELVVTGWGGMASQESGLRVTYFCPSCRHRTYSVAEPSQIIDPVAWDGSDFFMVWPLPRYVFVSNRLADIIRQSRFTGVELIPAADIRMKRNSTLTPGPLTDWMPERRAHELAKKFDVL